MAGLFAVVYRWKVEAGYEEAFEQEWHEGTVAIREKYASFGSKLHMAEDGTYVAYALWPNKAGWEQMMEDSKNVVRPHRVPVAEPLCLTVIDDLLTA